MLTAIIAGVAAALLAVVLVAVVSNVVSKTKSPHAKSAKKVSMLDTVGVGTSPFERHSAARGALAGEVRVGSGQGGAKKPADNLHSRFLALGVLAAGIFGSLSVKLWTLQIMGGDRYATDAEQNLYSTVSTPAPRGYILDSQGVALVKNRSSQTVLADADVADDRDLVRRLSAVLGLPANVVRQRIQDSSSGALSQRVVASDVRLRDVAFISEHAEAFPGVSVETRSVREYPYGALAAHVLGYTGSPSEDQLDLEREGRDVKATDMIGKSGIESQYDDLLAGDHGSRRVKVDVKGNILEVVSETQPAKGSDVVLTIDSRVQYVADSALANLIAPEGVIGKGRGLGGAAVVMDVRDGSIIAMSSFPTFDPTNFTGGISQDVWDLYNSEESQAPLNNRVVSGQYPAASTYKAFTSLAGLRHGFATKESIWNCTGRWDGFGTGDVQRCHLRSGHGDLDLRGGIAFSCDTVFYEIAKAFYDHGPYGTDELSETALQEEIAKFNLDKKTGIDLANEASGRIPTPEWKAEQWRNVPSEAQWRGGDYTNMVIGQGDVLVSPIQIAVGYGAVATGKLVKPHLLKEVRNALGETVVSFEPEVVGEPDVKKEHLEYVRDGLRGVITDNAGTFDLFEGYGLYAAGKSGTGEVASAPDDTAWFVAYAPYDDPKYVTAVVVESGGGGSAVAAPVCARILAAAMEADAGTLEVNPSRLDGFTGKVEEYAGSGEARSD